MTEVTAQLNGLRIAPRKVRLLVDLIQSKDVDMALSQLAHFTRRGSPPLVKLIESAVANAENNFKLKRDGLYIKEMSVDEGVKLKRYMPKGFGRAGEIQKKTSRVSIVLAVRESKEKPEIKPTTK
jgi:large subunit ribosomal protein L22